MRAIVSYRIAAAVRLFDLGKDFSRMASMKIKRQDLAEEISKGVERGAVVGL